MPIFLDAGDALSPPCAVVYPLVQPPPMRNSLTRQQKTYQLKYEETPIFRALLKKSKINTGGYTTKWQGIDWVTVSIIHVTPIGLDHLIFFV